MTNFIKVHESNCTYIHETMVNTDRIEYFQEDDSTADNRARISLASGESIYTVESVEEIKKLMYEVPEEALDAFVQSVKKVKEYTGHLK